MPLKVDSRATQETAFTRTAGREERIEGGVRGFSLELLEQEQLEEQVVNKILTIFLGNEIFVEKAS